ncbi:MAG: NAD(P)-dependent glycerol-3-phosphate dehydrogenase [Zoogloeaceae bacterium]|jgi:glycerol-3-phosphate dehydrogenase (NAD(P)+)|nr:NAD(P)-dependent glycerol-3-phosphate dehydrogenase [Zoogloeaceae bacterium]
MKLAVLAAGAWGSALALAFSRLPSVSVYLWAREPDVADEILRRRVNSRFLPGFVFPDSVRVSSVLEEAVFEADRVLIATSVAGLRSTFVALRDLWRGRPSAPILWACKGFEEKTGSLPHAVLEDVFGADGACGWAYGALSGPTFAQEVAAGLPAAITLAARDMRFATETARDLHGGHLRLYAHDDLVGVEVGGALKNILAIATGVCDGLRLGHNARAALMTRGLAEMARLGVALGGRKETFLGLSGTGDTILTCTGDLSRNRRVGLALAEGKALPEILAELGHVAEGVMTAREAYCLAAKRGIDLPITEAVRRLLDGELTPREAVTSLLAREPANTETR